MDGVELDFEDDAVEEIAKRAVERETGARGLRTIVEDIMLDIMYEIPSMPDAKKVIITRDSVLKKGSPKIITEQKSSKRDLKLHSNIKFRLADKYTSEHNLFSV